MYSLLLTTHSLVRWLVLISLLFAIYKAYRGWLMQKAFTKFDNSAAKFAVSMVHLQFTIGVCLYVVSPITTYFLHNFKAAVHERQIRFFGMEHVTMMVIAVALITAGSSIAKRKATDPEKFKAIAIWFTIGLLLILSSIPWQFSPFTSRPYFRSF